MRYCVREYVGECMRECVRDGEEGREYNLEHTVCDEEFSLDTTVDTISCLVRESV